MLARCAKKVIFDQELMVDDIREQKLAQNCRTRDNFVRDWLHQLLYWVLSLLLVGSGANFLPIEAHGFSLLDATLHYISSLSCNNKNAKVQKKKSAGHNRDPRIPSPRHNTTHIFLSFLQSSKCNKCNKMHSSTLFANRCPRILYPRRNNTLHILPVLQSSKCNKMQRSKVFVNQGPRILYPQHNTFFLQSTFFHSR